MSSKKKSAALTFEDAIKDLETLVQDLEHGDLNLDVALEIVMDIRNAEQKKKRIQELKNAVLKLEQLYLRFKSNQHKQFLKQNMRLLVEREKLIELYESKFENLSDGCHNLDEFCLMMTSVDPLLSRRELSNIWMEEMALQNEAFENDHNSFRKESMGSDSVVMDESQLVDDFSDGEDNTDYESGTHFRFNGISNENFVRFVWRLGYQLNTTTMRWNRKGTGNGNLDKYGNDIVTNDGKGKHIPVNTKL